jgi:hypothetical protein
LKQYFEAAKMQNLLVEERKQELTDEGKKESAQQATDAELHRLEEVCDVLREVTWTPILTTVQS